MIEFKEIQKLFPQKLTREQAAELNAIRKKITSLKTDAEKEAYFEELKRQYAPQNDQNANNADAKKTSKTTKNKKENKTSSDKSRKNKKSTQREIRDKIIEDLSQAVFAYCDAGNPMPEESKREIARIVGLENEEEREKEIIAFKEKYKTTKEEKKMTETENTPAKKANDQEFEIIPHNNETNSSQEKAEEIVKFFIEKHHLNIDEKTRKEMITYCKSNGNLNGFFLPATTTKKKLKVSEGNTAQPAPQPQNQAEVKPEVIEDDLATIEQAWRNWCETQKVENSEEIARNFEKIETQDGSLKFEIKPTEAQKAANPEDKGAQVTYYDAENVVMPMSEYAYFDQLVKTAKEVSGSEVIECGEIKTPAYHTRLIAAAYKHGLDVENAPSHLDLSQEAIRGIEDETLLKVIDKQIFHRDTKIAEKADYDTVKDGLRLYKELKEKTPDENGISQKITSLNIAELQISDEATKNKVIAAALEMGLKIEGVEKLNLGENAKDIPEEARRLLGTLQVSLLRNRVNKIHDPNTSDEERKSLQTQKMRDFEDKDKSALIKEQIDILRNKDASKEAKDLAGVRLDTLQGKRWEQGYQNKRNGRE